MYTYLVVKEKVNVKRVQGGQLKDIMPTYLHAGNTLHGGVEKCPPSPFRVVDDMCDFVDEQVGHELQRGKEEDGFELVINRSTKRAM